MPRRAAGAGIGRRGRSRRASTGALVAIAVAISATVMIGLTASAVLARASCTNQPAVVNVAVSIDISPAIDQIATVFNNQHHLADGKCVQVEITPGEPSAVAAQIDGQDMLPGVPPVDAWIPDSSLWVDISRSYPVGAQVVQPTGVAVARSPLMIVAPKAVAAATHVFSSPVGWNLLLPSTAGGPAASLGLHVDLPDPSDSAAGLASIIQVDRLLGFGESARAAFTRFVFGAQATAQFNTAAALESFVASTGPPFGRRALTVTSEQAVLAYDKANPTQRLVARYPTGTSSSLGSPELDYPYVLTTSVPALSQAAVEFGKALQQSYAQSVIRYYGFRGSNGVPDVMPAADDLSSQILQRATVPSASEASADLQIWQKLGLGSRDLALIDVSAAMSKPDGNGDQTLEQELTMTASRGLGLFPDTTHLGLWEVADDLPQSHGKPYESLVSLGPLPANYGVITRREQLQQIIENLRPGTGGLALNDAVLAAYKSMTASYTPNYSNAVLILTSGDGDARNDMSLAKVVAKLKSLYNPSRKVEIVAIMFGKGDIGPLRELVRATDGVAYQISNPAEVGSIFIKAIAQRMCDSGCAAP